MRIDATMFAAVIAMDDRRQRRSAAAEHLVAHLRVGRHHLFQCKLGPLVFFGCERLGLRNTSKELNR